MNFVYTENTVGAPVMVWQTLTVLSQCFFSKREGFNNTGAKIRKIKNTELLPFPFVKLAKNKERPCPHLHSASSRLD